MMYEIFSCVNSHVTNEINVKLELDSTCKSVQKVPLKVCKHAKPGTCVFRFIPSLLRCQHTHFFITL